MARRRKPPGRSLFVVLCGVLTVWKLPWSFSFSSPPASQSSLRGVQDNVGTMDLDAWAAALETQPPSRSGGASASFGVRNQRSRSRVQPPTTLKATADDVLRMPTNLLLLKACNVAAYVLNFYFNNKYGEGIRPVTKAFDHIAMPKAPAFAIWALIFAWTLGFVGTQAFSTMFDDLLPSLTPWFCLAQLMQGGWVPIHAQAAPGKPYANMFFWLSTLQLVLTAPVFLKNVLILSDVRDSPSKYWVSYGITMNAAWILLAAGLSLNMAAVKAGFGSTMLSAVALAVLSITVCLELWITGLVGDNPFKSPSAFFPVGMWALSWVFMYLRNIPGEDSDHAKKILPKYGSSFVIFYKYSAAILSFVFAALQVLVRRGEQSL